MKKLFCLPFVVLCACGQPGAIDKQQQMPVEKTYLASDVVLSEGFSLSDNQSEKIRPEQILLSNDSSVGKLASKNLKDALQNEIAVKLSDAIVGKWKIKNQLAEKFNPIFKPKNNNGSSAEIEIDSTGNVNFISGCLSFINTVACKDYTEYEFTIGKVRAIGNGVLTFDYTVKSESGKEYNITAVTMVAELNSSNITVINYKTKAMVSDSAEIEIAIFTRVTTQE